MGKVIKCESDCTRTEHKESLHHNGTISAVSKKWEKNVHIIGKTVERTWLFGEKSDMTQKHNAKVLNGKMYSLWDWKKCECQKYYTLHIFSSKTNSELDILPSCFGMFMTVQSLQKTKSLANFASWQCIFSHRTFVKQFWNKR